VPRGNLVEVRFDDLESDLVGEMKRIYQELGWDGYENTAKPKIEAYASAKKE
jgi:hypothetical protein